MFSKKTTMPLLVALSTCFNVSHAQELNAGPPDSGFKNLKIFASDGTSKVNIFANGNMQAKLDIIYDLAPGYELKDIHLKQLNTEDELEGWKISDTSNQYLHQIDNLSSTMSVSDSMTAHRYISTEDEIPNSISVCVEATAIKDGVETKKSTCNAQTSNAFVYINAIAPHYLGKEDFNLTSWADSPILDKWEESIEIKEQTLMKKPNTPRILSVESDSWHKGDDAIYAENAFVLENYVKNLPKQVSQVASWLESDSYQTSVKFVENTGLNSTWGTTKELPIPYYRKNEKNYITTFVTQILKGDKFLLKENQWHYNLCAEQTFPWGTFDQHYYKCQNIGELWQVAPEYGYNVNNVTWINRPSNTLKVTDIYGTTSELKFGMGQINGYGYSSDYRELQII
ncbi:hypothetical protein VAS14_15987 [Vibrio angustum S14]|uniref:Uncharacterized protein n=1 Tax=Photobacterium angustum (strain S14 / CCUG 15956) TaxID=314292 RepID=Q1ZME3_PHOAS|nr:hypothetical protein [Photobacterium angustum]EAS63297.1 hypothetical protein VAS14_15987 [Vibrio angustum S14] [Photobacterium angustum S14]